MRRNLPVASVAALALAALLAGGCAQSDGAISSRVKSKLSGDERTRASSIAVETKDRVVTLTGTVESDAARQEAVSIARETHGVADVVDELTLPIPPEAFATPAPPSQPGSPPPADSSPR
jgi:hyperosmotically inducible protein